MKDRLPKSLLMFIAQPPQSPRPGVQRPRHQHYPAYLFHLPHSETQGIISIVDHQGSPTSGISWAVLLFYPLRVQGPPASLRGTGEHEDIEVHRVALEAVPRFVEAKRAEGAAIDVKLLLLLGSALP